MQAKKWEMVMTNSNNLNREKYKEVEGLIIKDSSILYINC